MPLDIHPERTEVLSLHKGDRSRLREIVGACLVGAFVAFLLIYCVSPAKAEEVPVYVAEHEGVRIQMLSTACTDPVSVNLTLQAPAQFVGRFKGLTSVWRMKDGSWKEFPGCWLEVKKAEIPGLEDDVFVLVFSDGAVVQTYRNDLMKKVGSGA